MPDNATMGNKIKQAATGHNIHPLLAARFSPYSFADKPVPVEVLGTLFEAARWAASSYNDQPWRYIVAMREQAEEFAKLLSCLVEGNQAWAKLAPVLAVGCAMKNLSRGGKPNPVALHDLGAASASLSLQATAMGLCVHQMVGILPERVHELFQLPPDAVAVTGLAIGFAGDGSSLPEAISKRDQSARSRKPLGEIVFSGLWNQAARI